jgi:hypothetical protein
VFKEIKVHKAQLVLKVLKVLKVTPEPVYKVHRAQKVILGLKVLLVQQVRQELKVLLAHQA